MDKTIELTGLIKSGKKHGTDKVSHGYLPHYAEHLPSEISSMLEIGCFHGSSLRMWRDVYGANAAIHVIDLFSDNKQASIESMQAEGFLCHKGDQSNYPFLRSIKNQFDLIIDDGSHNAHHQQLTFMELFMNNLKPGGIYVVEDLHCCLEPFYWNDEITCLDDTILGAMTNFIEDRSLNEYFNRYQKSWISKHIADVKIYSNKIAFITKK